MLKISWFYDADEFDRRFFLPSEPLFHQSVTEPSKPVVYSLQISITTILFTFVQRHKPEYIPLTPSFLLNPL